MTEIRPECAAVRDEFSALLDGELPAAERERVEDHLADCAECLRALNRFKRVDDVYAGLAAVRAPEGFEDGVREALQPSRVKPFPIRPVVGTLLAAAAAVLIVVTVWPRTAVAPGDGGFQLSKTMEEAESRPAGSEAPAPGRSEVEPTLSMEQGAGGAGDDADTEGVGESAFADEFAVREEMSASETRQQAGQLETGLEGEDDLANMASGEDRAAQAPVGDTRSVAAEPELTDAAALAEPSVEEEKPADANEMDAGRRDLLSAESAEPETAWRPEMRKREAVSVADSSEGSEPAIAAEAEQGPESFEAQRLSRAPKPAAPAPAESVATGSKEQPVRTFEVRDGVWYETGYSGQPVEEVPRESDLLDKLIEADATVEELAENDSRIVFSVNGTWYALAAR